MPCKSADSVFTVHDAELPSKATLEQRIVAPSQKVTDPALLGSPAREVTVAVKVRESPYVLGDEPEVRETLVLVRRRAKKSTLAVVPPVTTVAVRGREPVFA
jgi:hypothetical protein